MASERSRLVDVTEEGVEEDLETTPTKDTKKTKKIILWVVVLIVIIVVVSLILGIVLSVQKKSDPLLIIISLDGFRHDYIDRGITPVLSSIGAEGVRAGYLSPIFPSKTFPNHYTLVTGLHAETHGIIANTFCDPVFEECFTISNSEAVGNAKWWGGEPIWNTAEKQGLISGCCFWPGSEAPIQDMRPTYWLPYDHNMPYEDRVNQVLEWLLYPKHKRPNLVTLYFSLVDDYGHEFGPENGNMTYALQEVDGVIGLLIDQLKEHGLYDRANLIVTADHGMTSIDLSRVIYIDDFINMTTVDIVDWSPIAAIIPKEGYEDSVYQNLSLAGPENHFEIYQKNGPNFIPERYHYADNRRITPLLLVCDLGWSIGTRKDVESNPSWFTGGNHGYDNQEMDMKGFFVARGPAFKKSTVIDPFNNIEVYNLLAEILGLFPAPNNGTLDSTLIQQALVASDQSL